MRIASKLLMGGLSLAFTGIAITSTILWYQASGESSEALVSAAEQRLTLTRRSLSRQLESTRDRIETQIQTLSASVATEEALRELSSGFTNYPLAGADDEAPLRKYYNDKFLQRYRQSNPETDFSAETILDGFSKTAQAIQIDYIANNPEPLGGKDAMTAAGTGTAYDEAHRRWHTTFRDFQSNFGYYDVFLVDAESDAIVYSVFKEVDFGTSLTTGPFSDSGIAEAYERAMGSEDTATSVLTDYADYTPSYEAPASFIASPVRIDGEVAGALIFQMPLETINGIMTFDKQWETFGLGASGEGYLVGPDHVLRSESRQLLENNDAFFEGLQQSDQPRSTIESIRNAGTAISRLERSSPAVEASFRGESGFQSFTDYRGAEVFASYEPFDYGGTRWALISQIDRSEALGPAVSLQETLLRQSVFWTIIILILASGATIVFSRRLVKPLIQTEEAMAGIAEGNGDLTRRLDEQRNDEIGAIAARFNQFVERLQNNLKSVEEQVLTLSSSADELTSVSESTRSAAATQLEKVDSAASGTSEMTSSFTEVARNAQDTSSETENAVQACQSTRQTMQELSTEVDKLADQIANASSAIRTVDKRSKRIEEVVEVINKITGQTNLLALNASIEAARAGESGRGFAVVAEEVRNLSQNTGKSTAEIREVINELLAETQEAAEMIGQIESSMRSSTQAVTSSLEEFDTITEQVNSVRSMNAQVASATEEQSQVAEEIDHNLQTIREQGQLMNQSTEEVSRTSEELSRVAASVKRVLGDFRF